MVLETSKDKEVIVNPWSEDILIYHRKPNGSVVKIVSSEAQG